MSTEVRDTPINVGVFESFSAARKYESI